MLRRTHGVRVARARKADQQQTLAAQQKHCYSGKQPRRHSQAERLGGLEVDHQLDLCLFQYRQVGRASHR
jgi:hypothetical protein